MGAPPVSQKMTQFVLNALGSDGDWVMGLGDRADGYHFEFRVIGVGGVWVTWRLLQGHWGLGLVG